MCFAPRYMNGAMAAPLMLSTNVASWSDTPWACASAGSHRTVAAVRAAVRAVVSAPAMRRRFRSEPRPVSLHVIGRVASFARFVERLARRKQRILVALDRRGPRNQARVDHVLGKLLPAL